MRRFWTPALLSSELPEPDGDPLHVELLGESFVAFRDTEGHIGFLDEACCHRGASLSVGRVESCGIRCLYHGWLFAKDGTILETPNVPDARFKERFKARAYPVREAAGIVWTYLGDPATVPEFPDLPFMSAAPQFHATALAVVGANYVQVLEGLLDSSHLGVLHSSALQANSTSELAYAQMTGHLRFDAAPRVEAEETEFGLHYAAVRVADGKADIRIAAFASPFWIFNPNGDVFLACVPMNDEKIAFFHLWYDGKSAFGTEPLRGKQLALVGLDPPTLERYRMTRATASGPSRLRRENGFGQDREPVRKGHFTGMASITQEDAIVSVSSGALRDRSKEHLSSADAAVAQLYRVLLRSVRGVESGGAPVGAGTSLAAINGQNANVAPDVEWRSLVPAHRRRTEARR